MALGFVRPSATLLREFSAVARRAKGFEGSLKDNPNIPEDALPLDEVGEILDVLTDLPSSTAEGGRLQLENADRRLNEMRHEYFVLLDPGEKDGDKDVEYFHERDFSLDDNLSLLIAAVRTALSVANREAGLQASELSPHTPIDPTDVGREISAALKDGREVIESISNAQAAGSKILNKETRSADTLMRILNDARGLARQAGVELRWERIVSPWLQGIANSLSRLPKLIRNAANAIQTAYDVLTPFYDQWKKFADDIENIVRNNIPKFVGNLRRAADRLEGRVKSERIMVYDDHENFIAEIADAVEQAGWFVYSSSSSEEAFVTAMKSPADVLFVQHVDENNNGTKMARSIIEQQPGIGVVIVTTMDLDVAKEEVGQLDWVLLKKPFDEAELERAIYSSIIVAKLRI